MREHYYLAEYIVNTFANAKGFAVIITTLRYSVKVKTELLITRSLF